MVLNSVGIKRRLTLVEDFKPIADDQGSRSTQVVVDDFLAKEEAQQARRELMHDTLWKAFITEQ